MLLKKIMAETTTNFGFQNLEDFSQSAFKFVENPKVLMISTTLGLLGTYIENYVGMKAVVFLCFIMLTLLEFITGISASIKQGKKIESQKLPRTLIKVIVYTLVIALMNILSKNFGQGEIWGLEINIYKWMYYSVVNVVILQLFISVFENLAKMGFSDSLKIMKFLTRKLNKVLDLDIENTGKKEPQEKAEDQANDERNI